MIKKPLVRALSAFVLLAVIFPAVNAAQLGVNYYDETLMNMNTHGKPFIQRSIEGVGQDFDNIKTISNHVKLYMDPFVNENLPWVMQVTDVAKSKGMHVMVNMMVDFPELNAGNWDDYANRVVNACAALNGKADGILVGNEITLHSPMSRTEIRDRVIALMDRCDAVFGGEVSYEEFWYANEVWRGTGRKIYFMMYESLDSFRGNMNELGAHFGSNGAIGEWGEDLLEGNQQFDEIWQRDSIRQRWNIIQQSSVPVAYLFTYREPSYTSFSMLRPEDDSRRPLWEVFGAPTNTPAPQPVPQPGPLPEPVPNPPAPQPIPEDPITINPLQTGDLKLSLGGSVKSDTFDGACRTVVFATDRGDVDVHACQKDGGTEMFIRNGPAMDYEVCVAGNCLMSYEGYKHFGGSSGTPSSGITSFAISGVTVNSDNFDGACRTVGFEGGEVKICDKGGSYELWLFGDGEVCVDNHCVGSLTSYTSW